NWKPANLPGVGTASRVALAGTQFWAPFSAPSGQTAFSDAARLDTFVAGNAPGHPILHASKTGTPLGDPTAWTSRENLGGATIGDPVALWSDANHLDLFVIWTNNQVYHRRWTNGSGWGPYESLGGFVRPDLVAVSPEPGVIDLYAIGGDTGIWHRTYD